MSTAHVHPAYLPINSVDSVEEPTTAISTVVANTAESMDDPCCDAETCTIPPQDTSPVVETSHAVFKMNRYGSDCSLH